ncbi:hypothetical protein RIEGSTA812A_PEG_348 [invertebrate metagenome]|uniref:Uncharacterized protein n=1 Tax=invertebrate metagenome TaxID=1711999 RepID=A0A484H6A1_9ZZZZ
MIILGLDTAEIVMADLPSSLGGCLLGGCRGSLSTSLDEQP